MSETILQLPPGAPKDISAATTLVPYRKDDVRSKYIGYLCSGFSVEESLFVLNLDFPWLQRMRQDSKFIEIEERVPELQREFRHEYAELDFWRNIRMVFEKDHRVLRRSLGMDIDGETGEAIPLSSYDQQYLLKLRSAYTPQQLQMLEAVAGSKSGDVNFAEWVKENQEVIQISRTDTLTLSRGRDGKTSENDS